MSEAALHAENLTRDFVRTRAVDGLNLNIPPGRVTALLGPNGAGKTTLLRLAAGLLEPTAGEVHVLGSPSRALPAEVCRRVVSVTEGLDPPKWEKIGDLLALQADVSAGFDRDRADTLLDSAGLARDARFGTLSKGQKRWVLCVLALAGDADLILMDEPADGLDPAARRRLYDAVRQCANDREATIVVATHIIGDIERVADDVAIIDRGRVILHAALEDLREQVREVELPSPAGEDQWGDGVDVIATRQTGDTALAWVRCRQGSADQLQARLGSEAVLRTVGLEALYLAVTDAAGDGAEEAIAC